MANELGQQVIDKIAEQTTIVAGLKVYNDGLRQKLKDAAAQSPLTPADVEKVFSDLGTNNQGIADAMVDNVP